MSLRPAWWTGRDLPAAASAEAATFLHKLAWAAAITLCTGYIIFFARLNSFPFQDVPNHLARGVIIADLLFHGGAHFGSSYSLALAPMPYIIHDLILASAIELFGPHAGMVGFMALVFLSLPLALLFYMHAARVAPHARLFVFLVSLYLSTDYFFLMGFMGFRLAVALVFVLLGLAEQLRRQWSAARFSAYVAVLLAGYFVHLTVPVFFLGVLAVSTAMRLLFGATNWRTELRVIAPVLAVFALHAILAAAPHAVAGPARYGFYWGTWPKKLSNLALEFARTGVHPSRLLLALFIVALLWPVRRAVRVAAFVRLPVLEWFAAAAAFLALYCVLPRTYADSSFVDVRALAMVSLMILLMILYLPQAVAGGRAFQTVPALALAAILATVNLADLARHSGRDGELLDQYREVAASVPRGARVLPIHTLALEGERYPLLHAGSYLVVDRQALIPYLFTGDRGDPVKYFRYRHRPYLPQEDWYKEQTRWNDKGVERSYSIQGHTYAWRFAYSDVDRDWLPVEFTPVDWNSVACDYDYLMVTLPVEPRMIEVPTRRIRANTAAELLAVDKAACRADLGRATLEIAQ